MKMNDALKKIAAAVLSVCMTLSLAACNKNISDNTSDTISDTISDDASESAAVSDSVSARVTVEGTKFMVDGKELWINGVNTPWQKWNDFTGQMDEEYWDNAFATLAADNVNCTRIWVNCAGESIVNLKTTGEIKSINEQHWTDLDKLFALAEKHGIYIMATLLSFDHFKEGSSGYDEWRMLITDKDLTDAYADTYVKEFCERYGSCEYLFSIDIMNEPDWVNENEECGKIDWENLSYFFGKCAATIHENSDILVTVGIGMVKYNSDNYSGNKVSDEYLQELTGNENAYLDFYSPHYYSWMKGQYGIPYSVSPVDFGVTDNTKPCLIGEAGNDDQTELGMSNPEKYTSAYENGWNGVMFWLQPEDDSWYEYESSVEATNAMAELAYDKIYPIGKKE